MKTRAQPLQLTELPYAGSSRIANTVNELANALRANGACALLNVANRLNKTAATAVYGHRQGHLRPRLEKAAEMLIKETAKRGIKIAVKGGVVGLAGALGGYAVWCATPWA